MLVIRNRPTEISRGAVVLVLAGSPCSSIPPSSAKRRLEWMRCGSHPERCVDVKIPRPPRPNGQDDYGACHRQAPTGQIRHHRPEQERCRTVVKDDGRDWSSGVNVKATFSFHPGLARKTVCSDQQNMVMWLVALKTSVTVAFSPHLRLPPFGALV